MRRIMIACALLVAATAVAAPNQRRYDNDDVRSAIAGMQHEVNNQQIEMRVFEEKLGTLDAAMDALRLELQQLRQQHKEKMNTAAFDADARMGAIDLSAKSAVSDIKILKGQLNEATAALGQFKSRVSALEKVIESQNQNIDALQAALRGLTDVLQGKESPKGTKTYVVKSGDALEKIARANQMTIEEIKELNSLTSNKIIVGQKLLVYER